MKLKNDLNDPDAFKLMYLEEDSDDEDAAFKADFDMPPLQENQAIADNTALVLVEKKNYKPKIKDAARKITFKTKILEFEGIDTEDNEPGLRK